MCMSMCKDCKPPRIPRHMGTQIILEKQICICLDCSVTELSDPPRCVKCQHILPVVLTEDATSWERFPLVIDPVSKRPVKLNEVLQK